jgi:hypothetical protein
MKPKSLLLIASSLLLTNCATIFSSFQNKQTTIDSVPSKLSFTVTDRDGKVISQGTTPSTVTLPPSYGYFKAGTYTVEVKKGNKVIGKETVSSGLNGWYFGNIAIGGLIGMLIVDPLTGAMYSSPDTITVNAQSMVAVGHNQSLQIVDISALSQAQRNKLVRI